MLRNWVDRNCISKILRNFQNEKGGKPFPGLKIRWLHPTPPPRPAPRATYEFSFGAYDEDFLAECWNDSLLLDSKRSQI